VPPRFRQLKLQGDPLPFSRVKIMVKKVVHNSLLIRLFKVYSCFCISSVLLVRHTNNFKENREKNVNCLCLSSNRRSDQCGPQLPCLILAHFPWNVFTLNQWKKDIGSKEKKLYVRYVSDYSLLLSDNNTYIDYGEFMMYQRVTITINTLKFVKTCNRTSFSWIWYVCLPWINKLFTGYIGSIKLGAAKLCRSF
jgi:hypothetical protein